jgi:hypothetical protein
MQAASACWTVNISVLELPREEVRGGGAGAGTGAMAGKIGAKPSLLYGGGVICGAGGAAGVAGVVKSAEAAGTVGAIGGGVGAAVAARGAAVETEAGTAAATAACASSKATLAEEDSVTGVGLPAAAGGSGSGSGGFGGGWWSITASPCSSDAAPTLEAAEYSWLSLGNAAADLSFSPGGVSAALARASSAGGWSIWS